MSKPTPKLLAKKSEFENHRTRSPDYFCSRNQKLAASNFDPYASMVQIELSSNLVHTECYVSEKSLHSYSEQGSTVRMLTNMDSSDDESTIGK